MHLVLAAAKMKIMHFMSSGYLQFNTWISENIAKQTCLVCKDKMKSHFRVVWYKRSRCGHQNVTSENDRREGLEMREIIQWLKCGLVLWEREKKVMMTWNRWMEGTWTALHFIKNKNTMAVVWRMNWRDVGLEAAHHIRVHFLVKANGLY